MLVFAGLGLDALSQLSWHNVGARFAPWGLPLLAVLALCETVPFGLALRAFPATALHEPWVEWLARHPGGALTTIPPAHGGKARDYEATNVAMLQSLRHGHPLTDGYSGFFPRSSDRLAALAARFPSPGSVRALTAAGARYVVVDNAWLAHQSPERIRDTWWKATRLVYRSPSRNIYQLSPR
jgi:hypothetical protein